MDPLVSGQEDVEHGLVGEISAVPDILYPGNVSLSLQECFRPGPKAYPYHYMVLG